MDLQSIKRKLSYNNYESASDFVRDMRLIWNNCYDYNGEDHEISAHAKEMEKSFEEGISEPEFSKFL